MTDPAYDLDHVAIATTGIGTALRTLTEIGGLPLAAGPGDGFRWAQVRLGDATSGMTVELLEPWAVEHNDFLARFVARSGPGPHHLTFKVPDLRAALERVEAAGYHPVGVALEDPEWKEAFLHPRESHGTVVQLAQTHPDFPPLVERVTLARDQGILGEPWWAESPEDASDRPHTGEDAVVLRQVVLRSPEPRHALALYGDVLGGRTTASGEDFVELGWPGGGHVRIETQAGDAPRIDRLVGEGPRPRELDIAGARLVVSS